MYDQTMIKHLKKRRHQRFSTKNKLVLFSLLFTVVLAVVAVIAANNSEKIQLGSKASNSDEYLLKSEDGKRLVVLNKKFGGAITKIYDLDNFDSQQNLIDDDQAGAMFQHAFWLLPYHSWVDSSKPLPPSCPDYDDKKLENPTQAGFYGDGLAGNPIGYVGTTTTPDSKEFITYEDKKKTVHLKTKFIRYDYCIGGIGAPINEPACDEAARNSYLNDPNATCQDLWDTDFYVEQWVSFHPELKHTLILKNKLTYEPADQKKAEMTSRQLPVIFTNDLNRSFVYEKGREQTSTARVVQRSPERKWGAMLAPDKDAGIGMFYTQDLRSMINGRGLFGFESNIEKGFSGQDVSAFGAGAGVLDLEAVGTLRQAALKSGSDHIISFSPGASYEWTVYVPIGNLEEIQTSAESLLFHHDSSKKLTTKITGFVDRADCQQKKISGWAINHFDRAQAVTVRAEVFPIGSFEDKVTFKTEANLTRSDLGDLGICPQGKCAFNLEIDQLPTSFQNQELGLNVWAVYDGKEAIIANKHNYLGICSDVFKDQADDLDNDDNNRETKNDDYKKSDQKLKEIEVDLPNTDQFNSKEDLKEKSSEKETTEPADRVAPVFLQ